MQLDNFRKVTPCGGIELETNEPVKLPSALPTRGVAKMSKTAQRNACVPPLLSSSSAAPAPRSQARGSESNASSIDCAPCAVKLAADAQSSHGASIARLAVANHSCHYDCERTASTLKRLSLSFFPASLK